MPAHSCAQCGLPVASTDRFCPHCGAEIRVSSAAEPSDLALDLSSPLKLNLPEITPTESSTTARPATEIIETPEMSSKDPEATVLLPAPAPHESDMSGFDIILGAPIEDDQTPNASNDSSDDAAQTNARAGQATATDDTDADAAQTNTRPNTNTEKPAEDTEQPYDEARTSTSDDPDSTDSAETTPEATHPGTTTRFEFIRPENPFDIESYIPQISNDTSSKTFEDDTIIMPVIPRVPDTQNTHLPDPFEPKTTADSDDEITRVIPQRYALSQDTEATRVIPQCSVAHTPAYQTSEATRVISQRHPERADTFSTSEATRIMPKANAFRPSDITSAPANSPSDAEDKTSTFAQVEAALYGDSLANPIASPYANWQNTTASANWSAPASQTAVMQPLNPHPGYVASSQPRNFEAAAPRQRHVPGFVIVLLILIIIGLAIAGFYKVSPDQTMAAAQQIQHALYQIGAGILDFARHVVGTGEAN